MSDLLYQVVRDLLKTEETILKDNDLLNQHILCSHNCSLVARCEACFSQHDFRLLTEMFGCGVEM